MNLIETRDALDDLLRQGIPPHTEIAIDNESLMVSVYFDAGTGLSSPRVVLSSVPPLHLKPITDVQGQKVFMWRRPDE